MNEIEVFYSQESIIKQPEPVQKKFNFIYLQQVNNRIIKIDSGFEKTIRITGYDYYLNKKGFRFSENIRLTNRIRKFQKRNL